MQLALAGLAFAVQSTCVSSPYLIDSDLCNLCSAGFDSRPVSLAMSGPPASLDMHVWQRVLNDNADVVLAGPTSAALADQAMQMLSSLSVEVSDPQPASAL
jgi:hypothetical protein